MYLSLSRHLRLSKLSKKILVAVTLCRHGVNICVEEIAIRRGHYIYIYSPL